MKPISAFVKRHSFVVFMVLAYALAWWPALFHAGTLPQGPLLAAVLVVGLGVDGVQQAWLRAAPWCLLALGLLLVTRPTLARTPAAQAETAAVSRPAPAQ